MKREFVVGVDGCKAGWVAVRLDLKGMTLNAEVADSFLDIVNGIGASAAAIMVDMPIGLADTGRRACEQMARDRLKPLRHSSVFSTPRRPMLQFSDYQEANQWGKAQGSAAGGGLSKQAWMITPKIHELDEILTPADQSRIAEAHPEVAFWRLNDRSPCLHAKRTPAGANERANLLKHHGLTGLEKIFTALRESHARGIARDDFYDACALALTAKARLDGAAVHLTDGAKDAKGLRMEIWG